MDVGKKRKSGSRLFQLALNDAIKSHLSLKSPVQILMEKEKMEKRNANRTKNKTPIQTDMTENKSSCVSPDKFSKNEKKTKNSDITNVSKNEYSSEISNNMKNCQECFESKDNFTIKNKIDTSNDESDWNSCNLQIRDKMCSPKPRRSSLLNEFECMWIPEENDSSSDISNKSISIDLSSPEWDEIESKGISSKDSNSEESIDYDLPVFPLSIDSESIQTEGLLQNYFFGDDLNSKMSDLSVKNSLEPAFSTLQTPALEFLQQSVVLNNFIPPPKVMGTKLNSTDDNGIPASYVHNNNIARSCKSLNNQKYNSEKLCTFRSEARLSEANYDNSSKFDPYLTLRHFKNMLPEDSFKGSSENTVEPNFLGNYPLNYSHILYPNAKSHSVHYSITGDSLEKSFKSQPNLNFMKTSCSYDNPSGLLEHFPEYKSVI